MLVPRNNSFDLFDDFFDHDFMPPKKERNLMKTDIKETKNAYLLDIDLPGFNKENINISLEKGYLNIAAKVEKENNTSHEENYIHRERFCGSCSRSFYVGEDIREDDIKAEFKNGILMIEVPKKNEEDKKKEIKQIEIKQVLKPIFIV